MESKFLEYLGISISLLICVLAILAWFKNVLNRHKDKTAETKNVGIKADEYDEEYHNDFSKVPGGPADIIQPPPRSIGYGYGDGGQSVIEDLERIGIKKDKIEIFKLSPQEAMRFKAIRLRSLAEDPDAFGTKFDTAKTWSDDNWISQVQKMNTFLAMIQGNDVGVIRLVKDEEDLDVAWLISMWVAPEARGKKVASKLLDFVIDFAKKDQIKVLKLDVVDSNIAAIALYEHYGFLENGVTSKLPTPREHITEHQRELKI